MPFCLGKRRKAAVANILRNKIIVSRIAFFISTSNLDANIRQDTFKTEKLVTRRNLLTSGSHLPKLRRLANAAYYCNAAVLSKKFFTSLLKDRLNFQFSSKRLDIPLHCMKCDIRTPLKFR